MRIWTDPMEGLTPEEQIEFKKLVEEDEAYLRELDRMTSAYTMPGMPRRVGRYYTNPKQKTLSECRPTRQTWTKT